MKKSFIIQIPLDEQLTVKLKINVYKDRESFIAGTGDTKALGLCQRYWKEDTSGNKLLHLRQVSTISLIEGHLGAGIVSHEAAHASVHIWSLMSNRKLTDSNDEPFAWILGDVVRKIYNGLYSRHIL